MVDLVGLGTLVTLRLVRIRFRIARAVEEELFLKGLPSHRHSLRDAWFEKIANGATGMCGKVDTKVP